MSDRTHLDPREPRDRILNILGWILTGAEQAGLSSAEHHEIFAKVSDCYQQVESDTCEAFEQHILSRTYNDETLSLGDDLAHYTDPNRPEYDPEFDKQIRKEAPHWFGHENN